MTTNSIDLNSLASAMHDAAIRYANGHTVDFQHEAREFLLESASQPAVQRCAQCGGAKVDPSPLLTGACDCASQPGGGEAEDGPEEYLEFSHDCYQRIAKVFTEVFEPTKRMSGVEITGMVCDLLRIVASELKDAGTVLAPLVATEEMLNATRGKNCSPGTWNNWQKKRHATIYRQMIAALAAPSAGNGGEEDGNG